MSELDVAGRIMTLITERNRSGGLLLCGIDWGMSAADKAAVEKGISIPPAPKGLFSDADINKSRFAQAIRRWFGYLGHPLSPEFPTAFEESIVQMNWAGTQRPHAGRQTARKLAEQRDEFLPYLSLLRPRLILFFSVALLGALNHPLCRDTAETVLGKAGQMKIQMRSGPEGTERWSVGTQEFGNAVAIGLPHPKPDGRSPPSEAFIRNLASDIGPIVADYRRRLS